MSEASSGENTSSGGNGDNQGGGGDRRRNRGRKNTNASKFEGKCEELKGYVYDIQHSDATESFQKTTQEVAEYISKEYERAGEFRTALVDLEFEALVEPVISDEDANNRVKVLKYERLAKAYDAKVEARQKNEGKAFPLILGQCSPAMRDRLEASDQWKKINTKTDVIELLKLIQSASTTRQTKQEPSHTLMEAYRDFFSFRQIHLSNSDYLQAFKDRLDVLERLAGPIGQDDARVTQKVHDEEFEISHAEARVACREAFIATTFLFGADKQRYGDLLVDLQNEHVISGRQYPATLTDAYNILVNYKSRLRRNKSQGLEGMAFVQDEDDDEDETSGSRGRGSRGGNKKCKGRNGRGKGNSGNGGGGSGNNSNTADHTNSGKAAGGSSGNQRGGATTKMTTDNGSKDNANFILQQADNMVNNSKFPPYSADLRAIESCFANSAGKQLPTSWVIMDSASSVDIIANKSFLTDVRKADQPMRVLCNAGVVNITHQGTLPGYPPRVWYHPTGVANILGLHNVGKHYRVTYDSAKDDAFHLHRGDGSTALFTASAKGLYHLDTTSNDAFHPGCLLTTTRDKKDEYDNRGYRQAEAARKVQNILMRPSTRDYMNIVTKGLLRNCPVEKRHIMAAEDIFGPNVGSLKGKTARRSTPHVVTDKDPVPADILQRYERITLAIDIMFVNTVPFFITISRGIRFGTVESLNNRQVPTIKRCLNNVIATYRRRGFQVDTVLADDEFSALRHELPGVDINCCGADEHVPEVERYIRTVKDRARSGYNDLPYEYIPRAMLDRLIGNSVFWLNAFPPATPSVLEYSPRYIMVGRHLDFNKHVRTEFGAYVQTHEQHDNSMAPRTVGAICLGPTGNAQGTHFFLSLQTGRLLRRPHWTELPTPDDVIARVSALGQAQGMPRSLTFADRYGHEVFDRDQDIDDAHDSDYTPDSDDDTTDDDLSVAASVDDPLLPPEPLQGPAAGVMNAEGHSTDTDSSAIDDVDIDDVDDYLSTSASSTGTEPNADTDEGSNQPSNNDHHTTIVGPLPDSPERDPTPPLVEANGTTGGLSHENTGVEHRSGITGVEPAAQQDEPPESTGVEDTGADDDDVNDGAQGTAASNRMNLRPRVRKDPTHILGRGFEDDFIFLTEQMSAKAGLKKFGKKGADAIVAEMEQLHYRRVLKPMLGKDLTREEKKKALQYLMFLKQKRCGKIKARGCADGRKQRVYKTKEETRSPTVRTESLFLSAIIDARERRRVVTCDIPGAFMQADMDEVVHVRFDGPLAQLLTRVDPNTYTKYLQQENGKDVLYVQLQKALYGTLQAAMLFWKELSAFLCGELGFKTNPYDSCVANKTINGKQCTVLWHVDDLKISHVDEKVLEDILRAINERFGKETPVSINRGRVHDYLGMTIDYSEDGKVKFKMDDFVEQLLEEGPEDMDGSAATPAANYLFQVNKNGKKLDGETAELFHHLVAKLLYLCKRARPDIHTAVAFLTTRVTSPDEDDYKKLGRCIKYLRSTKDLYLTLEADVDGRIRWWVDASFAVHPDMKSHTGAVLSLGKGAAYSMSTRQRINTKSSTEAELVGVDDAMPNIIWTQNFLRSQGYAVKGNVVYQDNQSAILLEKNGRASSGKRTRHVDIRYFFITDRIQHGEVTIEYCPTDEMNADVLTKPLQGSTFRKFRDRILNISSTTDKDHQQATRSQECVGDGKDTVPEAPESRLESCMVTHVGDERGPGWILVSSKRNRKRIVRGSS